MTSYGIRRVFVHRQAGGTEEFGDLYEAERKARPGDHIEKVLADGTSECVEVRGRGWPWALSRDYILLHPGRPCPPSEGATEERPESSS